MFVLKSKYDALMRNAIETEIRFNQLLKQWNDLVSEINKKGGREFLDRNLEPPLENEDIKKLLVLCHPDKHNGKEIATEMTKKLLRMRKCE